MKQIPKSMQFVVLTCLVSWVAAGIAIFLGNFAGIPKFLFQSRAWRAQIFRTYTRVCNQFVGHEPATAV
jgi:hypothetical protein